MDYAIWNQILYELTFSVSGEQELDQLIKKAASAFLKKLDCAYVSISQDKDDRLETACVIPRIALKNPAYYELIAEFNNLLLQNQPSKFIVLRKELYYYGFPLPNFGLLIIGKHEPVDEIFLKELVPVTEMLGQNCFFTLDAIEKRRVVEAELKQERHLLRVIIDTIPDLVFHKDVNGVYKVVNQATADFFALPPEKIIGRTIWEIHSLPEANKCWETDCEAIESRHTKRYESQLTHPVEGLQPFDILKAPIYVAENECIGTVAVCRGIKERKRYEQQLKYMGTHDQLTGLYNRRFFERELKRSDIWERQLPLSIIMGDLNGLKLINDVFGHQEGDDLIIKAAEIIKKSCRKEDLIIRWGGDEFVIILPGAGAEIAEKVSRRIQNKCRSQSGGHLPVSIALGWAIKNIATENIWQILKEASDKMYSDKLMNARYYSNTVIISLKSALANKSTETAEHLERLRTLCREIGEYMGLNTSNLNDLVLLAELHDIGKVAIKKSILLKPGPLTKEEWIQIKKHPEIGYRFAMAVPGLTSIAEYILCHHERWDGSGYPKGIKGEEIPLLSRILAVADAYDAMTNDRSYRQSMTREEAIVILKSNAGKQFDPRVVKVFCQLPGFHGDSADPLNCAMHPG